MIKITSPLIIILRHGQTKWNLQGKYQGISDIGLAEIGKMQAQENAKWLRSFLIANDIKQIDCITSPLNRARQSMEIIRQYIETSSLVIDENFIELNFGNWQGLTSQQVKEKFYLQRKARKQDKWHFKARGGESLAGRSTAVVLAMQAISKPTVIMTHNGIIRILQHWLGGQEKQQAAQFNMPHTARLVWQNGKLIIYENKNNS